MGHVEGIYLAAGPGEQLGEVPEVRAVPGKGIEGDRYFWGAGKFSARPGFRQLTLIESETIEAVARDYGIELMPGDSRRNILTRGVALNHLVGVEFVVGDVRVAGRKLCEPCEHLEQVSGRAGIRKALRHRGGLRVDILSGGVIRKGDPVELA
ncbi:MAG: MOSC domain-containing protein [Actinomycetota bacterium]